MACTSEKSASLVPVLFALASRMTAARYCSSWKSFLLPTAALTATPTTTSSTATIPVHMPTPNYTTPVATATSAALQLLPVVLQVFASGLLRMAGVLE